jgi:spore germination cell wall hydrolase CwlJ-like protein
MYTKLLLRSILVMLFITEVGFLVLLSGFNPHNIKAEEVVELPTPTFYSVDEVEERLRVTEAATEIVVENHITYINEQEYDCLVKNIYFEARNQPIKGKQAIAAVTLTRAKHKNFPDSICKVVSEQRKRGVCQFSWKCDGKSDNPDLSSKEELTAWRRAKAVAEDALLGKLDDMLDGVTHFHASYVNPSWARKLTKVGKIGDHIFYKET